MCSSSSACSWRNGSVGRITALLPRRRLTTTLPVVPRGSRRGIPGEARRRPATIARVRVVDVETPHGFARVHVRHADRPVGGLVLGHGAGGGVAAPDLVAVADAAIAAQVSVGLVEQPYRV